MLFNGKGTTFKFDENSLQAFEIMYNVSDYAIGAILGQHVKKKFTQFTMQVRHFLTLRRIIPLLKNNY